MIDHTWADVAYVALILAVTLINVLHNKKIARKADTAVDIAGAVVQAVDDVKRATGVVKRAEDPDPPPLPVPAEVPGHRRITDPPLGQE